MYKTLSPIRVIDSYGDDINLNNHIIINIKNKNVHLENHYSYDSDRYINDEIDLYAFNMKEVLYDVCELGKTFCKNFKYEIDSCDEIENYEYIYDEILTWIDKVEYEPFAKDEKDLFIKFAKYSMICYLFQQLNICLYKSTNEGKAQIGKNFKTIYNSLKKILLYGLEEAININLFNIEEEKYSDSYEKLKQLSIDDENDIHYAYEKRKDGHQYLKKSVQKLLRKSMLTYIYLLSNDSYSETGYEFNITKQTPIYNPSTKQYRIYYMSNSLIAIAYYQLLLNLTAGKNSIERRTCKAQGCFNEIEVCGNRQYCDEHISSRLRKAKFDENKRQLQRQIKSLTSKNIIRKKISTELLTNAIELANLNAYQLNNTKISLLRNTIKELYNIAGVSHKD